MEGADAGDLASFGDDGGFMEPLGEPPKYLIYWMIATCLCGCSALCGCSVWRHENDNTMVSKLPPARMSADSVGLEIATVSFHLRDADAADEIYLDLDEQVMSTGRRRLLSSNGFRIGVLGTQLPPLVHALLKMAADRRERPTAESVSEGLDSQRFLQCRSGQEHPIDLAPSVMKLTMPHFDGDTKFAEVLTDAACGMLVKCKPQGHQAATVRLVPTVEHGALRQKFVVQDGAFHMAAGRDRNTYQDLVADIRLNAGETLLMTCTSDQDSMGHRFFVNPTTKRQKILLIRLAQTQPKPLFSQRRDAPLTTTED